MTSSKHPRAAIQKGQRLRVACVAWLLTGAVGAADLPAIQAPGAQLPSLPVDSAPTPRVDTSPATASIASGEHVLYRSNLLYALTVQRALQDRRFLALVEKSIAAGQMLDERRGRILTIRANTLLSVGAVAFRSELPDLYAELDHVMSLIDRADKAGLYVVPETVGRHLHYWRAVRQISDLTEKAPWIVGPRSVAIDPALMPVAVPAGFRLLLSADLKQLEVDRQQIRDLAVKILPEGERPAGRRVSTRDQHLISPMDGRWTGTLFVVKDRHVPLAVSLPANPDATLALVKSRRDPISNLNWKQTGQYSRDYVRWLIKPEKDEARAVVRWGMTDGAVAQPLGINYAHMVLGANQQLVLALTDFPVAEVLFDPPEVYGTFLPRDRQPYKAEYQLDAALKALQPLLDSLQFVAAQRVEHAKAMPERSVTSLDTLITGGPTLMERGVQRAMADIERRGNFWYFLQDHPQYQGYVLAIVVALILGIRRGVEGYMQDDNVWKNVAKRGLAVLAVAAIVVLGFMLVLWNQA